jgi:IS605 OrfB family transposase
MASAQGVTPEEGGQGTSALSSRQRRDFHCKEAAKLVRANDVIYYEDVQVRNLVRNRHLAKSISDAGWSQFLSILSFKAACAGRTVRAVPPAYTSQDCSGCGERVPKSLSVRTLIFPNCSAVASSSRTQSPFRFMRWRAIGHPYRHVTQFGPMTAITTRQCSNAV